MRGLLTFLLGPEVRNYLHWRWRRQPFTIWAIPFEWAWATLRLALSRVIARCLETGHLRRSAAVPFEPRAPRAFFVAPDDVPSVAALARRLCPAEVAAIADNAESMQRGRMPLVTGAELEFVRPDWRPRVDDLEHLFCLNRWSHGVTLAKAWVYTGDVRHVRHWLGLLQDWVAANPPDVSSPAWESYSVSERMVNWCLCVSFLWSAADFQERGLPLLSAELARHAAWLAVHLETRTAHNHLINNARALYVYGALFGAEEHRARGWDILERELSRQVLPDGMLGEQSTHYHLLLTRTYIEVSRVAEQIGQPLPAVSREHVCRMIAAGKAFVRADGSIPVIGDFSPDTDVRALVGVLAAGQVHYAVEGGGAAPLSEHGVWYLNLSEVEAWKSDQHFPERTSSYLPDAGYCVCAGRQLHLVLQADPRGRIIRHGHQDVLGVSVWSRGDVLTDSGNASYADDRWLEYFRGPLAHNTLTIDDLPPYANPGRFGEFLSARYQQAAAQTSVPEQVERWWWVEAEHSGYARLAAGVSVRRRVLVAPEYVWITDNVSGDGDHTAEMRWHWGSNTVRELAPGSWDIVASERAVARAQWFKDGELAVLRWLHGQTVPTIEGWYSPAYGVKQPATTAVLRATFTSTLRLDLLLWLDMQQSLASFVPERDAPARIACTAWADEVQFTTAPRRMHVARRSLA